MYTHRKEPSFIVKTKARFFEMVLRGYYYYLHRKNHRKYVVLGNRQVGIGNRIIALANIYSWCGNENISLLWALDNWVTMPFDELFEMTDAPGFKSVSFKRKSWSRQLNVPDMPNGTTEFWQFWIPPAYREGFIHGRKNDKALFCRYNEIPQWAKDVYSGFFRQLKPSKRVLSRINECQLPKDVVCVQLRNSHATNDHTIVSRIDKFIEKMMAYGKSQKFFISCMEKDISDQIKAVFGSRILELPDKNYRSMCDAVADMWLLGGGKELICQWGSTFPEVAWWWRGGQAKVTALPQEFRQCPAL